MAPSTRPKSTACWPRTTEGAFQPSRRDHYGGSDPPKGRGAGAHMRAHQLLPPEAAAGGPKKGGRSLHDDPSGASPAGRVNGPQGRTFLPGGVGGVRRSPLPVRILGARASRPHPVPLAAAELQCDAAGSHPVGGNPIGQAVGEPWRRSRLIQVGEMAEAVPGFVRAGRPRSQEAIIVRAGRPRSQEAVIP